MFRKWISMLLVAMLLLGMSATAFADSEAEEAPASAAEEGPVACEPEMIDAETEGEEPPAEAEVETPAVLEYEEEAAPVSVSGVPVNLTGATDAFQSLHYYGVNGSFETAEENVVLAGATVLVYLAPGNTLTVENGTVTEERYDISGEYSVPSLPDYKMNLESIRVNSRIFHVTAPESGTMTVHITPSDDPLPTLIPVTFYNEEMLEGIDFNGVGWHNTLPDGAGQYVLAGGASMKISVKQDYTVEVLQGGCVTEVGLPAYSEWHPDCIAVTVQADIGADEIVVAIVKKGEHYAGSTEGEQTQTDGVFSDVSEGSWYADVVEEAYSMGIVKGTSEDTFSPNSTTTRGQAVTMLYRMEGSPAVTGGAGFDDLTEDYYQDAVAWAAADGVVKGVSATRFDPDASITREQWALMLYRMAGEPIPYAGGLLEQFSDYDVTDYDYAYAAMLWAVDNGLISGYGDSTLRPTATATRAEVCAMLMRYRALYQ